MSSGNSQAKAITKSAKIQAEVSREQMALQEKLFNQQQSFLKEQEDYNRLILQQNREKYEPMLQGGQLGYEALVSYILDPNSEFNQKFTGENLQNDAGYQFRLNEGNNALNNSLVNKYGLLSGAAAKQGIQYNQDFASNEFQNAFNRDQVEKTNKYNGLNTLGNYYNQALSGWTGNNQGTNIGSQLSGISQNYTNSISDIMQNNANAQMQAAMAQAQGGSGFASALGGAGSGALSGAAMGSAVPGIGTAFGAAIGAGMGLLGGYLK